MGRAKRVPVSPDEREALQAEMRTQGVKGAGCNRLNVSLTDENIHVLTVLARVTGQSEARVVNRILKIWKEDNPDVVEKAEVFFAEARKQFPGLVDEVDV